MSQVNSVKDLRNKHAKCLVQNRGKTSLIDIKGSSYDRPRTTVEAQVVYIFFCIASKFCTSLTDFSDLNNCKPQKYCKLELT